ncbi:hypothetical protein E1B28_006678 [Marasmius oreades]|uniref:DUF431-domain-containing protein n=1 Tax=Marasmius oreades TaxID=181124 RepID=A0A9P8A9Q6_9AGAR|nr:uncharacterized protein E1B28_006678 [Marasmius oreades]KAG7095996.1 hypothetical protein E1B28_006678 [Marasmius oreades]
MTEGFTYVIEHMEDDDEVSKTVPPWVDLEYARISCSTCEPLQVLDLAYTSRIYPKHLHKPSNPRILEIIKQEFHGSLGKVCLLDPKAEKELSPEDGDGRFQWFLFGGILGDDPPRDRTSELRVLGIPSRHLGSVQMTTDTALGVTKRVVHDKVPLDKIEYIDFPNITFNRKESVEMPFRYMVEESTREPLLPPGMRKLLHEDLNKSFDF